jgi:hypothetical protein
MGNRCVAGNAISNNRTDTSARTDLVLGVDLDVNLTGCSSRCSGSRGFTSKDCNLDRLGCLSACLALRSSAYHYCSGKVRAINHVSVGAWIERLQRRFRSAREFFNVVVFERSDASELIASAAWIAPCAALEPVRAVGAERSRIKPRQPGFGRKLTTQRIKIDRRGWSAIVAGGGSEDGSFRIGSQPIVIAKRGGCFW